MRSPRGHAVSIMEPHTPTTVLAAFGGSAGWGGRGYGGNRGASPTRSA